jgi:hypothetical protein
MGAESRVYKTTIGIFIYCHGVHVSDRWQKLENPRKIDSYLHRLYAYAKTSQYLLLLYASESSCCLGAGLEIPRKNRIFLRIYIVVKPGVDVQVQKTKPYLYVFCDRGRIAILETSSFFVVFLIRVWSSASSADSIAIAIDLPTRSSPFDLPWPRYFYASQSPSLSLPAELRRKWRL